MKKFVVFTLISILVSIVGKAQVLKYKGRFEKQGENLYLIENSKKVLIDTKSITVKLKPSTKLSTKEVVLRSNLLGYIDLAVPKGIDVQTYVSQLEKKDIFEMIKYNFIGTCCSLTNDDFVDLQWYLDSIQAPDAWTISKGCPNVKVAVIDIGFNNTHPDLDYGLDNYKNIDTTLGYDYTNMPCISYHGTLVSGIIAAKSNNYIGIAGIAGGNNSPGACILPFGVSSSQYGDPYIEGNYIDDAIILAVNNGAKIINMSFGFSLNSNEYYPDMDAAINYAYNHGVTLIAASGNENGDVYYPAAHPNVIAIGGLKQTLQRHPESNYGLGLDLCAPGENICSIAANEGAQARSGTSFAAPQVTGVVALMLSVNPSLTPSQIREILCSTCKKLPNYTYNDAGWNEEVGYGLLNAYNALIAANSSISGETVICDTATYTLSGIPTGLSISWNINNSNFTTTPSGYQCFVEYTGFPLYNVANLTATISRQGTTITTLTKRIVMHGTNLYVEGWQYGGTITTNGVFPDREFTIPADNGLILSRTKPDRPSMDDIFGKDKESLPINFTRDLTLVNPDLPPFDVCGYGITEINGGNTVYLNSTRFDGMDISFSSAHSPTSYYHNEDYIAFELPYSNDVYYTKLFAESDSQCHDFCLMFKVVPLPGAASGDDIIWVNLSGSMLYITYEGAIGTPIGNGQYYNPPYTVTISKIPSGTQVYSNTFPGGQTEFSVNTSSWTSGIYSIRIVQSNNVYTKSIYL